MPESDSIESIEAVETDSPAPASAPAQPTTAPAASKPTASTDAPADDEPVADNADHPDGDDQQAPAKPGDDAPAKPGRWEKRVNRLTAKLSERDRAYQAEREAREAAEARLRDLEQERTAAAQREPRPTADTYDSVEEFEDALADWKIRQREADAQARAASEPPKKPADGQARGEPAEPRQASDKELASYVEAKAKYPDLDEVFGDASLPWSVHMADAVADLDNSAEVLYHLGSDPDEMERIAALPPAAQIREVGKFADKLAAKLSPGTDTPATPNPTPDDSRSEPQARQQPGTRVTQAKPVPKPVSGSAPPSKSLDDMDQAEFERYMNEQDRMAARR